MSRILEALSLLIDPTRYHQQVHREAEAELRRRQTPPFVRFPAGRYTISNIESSFGHTRTTTFLNGYTITARGESNDGDSYCGQQFFSRFLFRAVDEPEIMDPQLLIAERTLTLPIIQAPRGVVRVDSTPYRLKGSIGREVEVTQYWTQSFEGDFNFARGALRVEYPTLQR